jgi:arginase
VTEFELVGVPYTSMAEPGGIANAISVFRDLDLAERLARLGVEDGGDLELKEPSGTRGPSGLLNEQALDHLVETTHTTVHAIRDRGRVPLMVGGDCPVLLGGLASIGPGTGPGLVMVDGHEDAWPPSSSETGEASDSEIAIALGRIQALPRPLPELIPLIAPSALAFFGPRDLAEIEEAGVESIRDQVAFFADDQDVLSADAPPEELMAAALEAIAAEAFWLHADLDALSTVSFAAVDYPQPGGFDWEVFDRLTASALADRRCRGASVVIYNPDLDPSGRDSEQVIDYTCRLVGKVESGGPAT